MACQQESKVSQTPQGPNVELFDKYMDQSRSTCIPVLEILNKKNQELIPITISFNTSHDATLTALRKEISNLTKKEWNCHICQMRSENLSLQMFINPRTESIESLFCSNSI